MRALPLLFASILISSCGKKTPTAIDNDLFAGKDGCLLLLNVKTDRVEYASNEARCRERFVACSTFKVALAVMAFDAGILKDETQTLRWDGEKRLLDIWNRDHNAATWMRDSVVWFSQRLTPKLKAARIQKYLRDFRYGNEDFSGGLTMAWLHAPDSNMPSLRISAYEQAEFMKALWTDRLPVARHATALTKKITFLEASPAGYRLSGKTGSNFYDNNQKKRLGWFIGHLQKDAAEYVVVVNFRDTEPARENEYGGKTAKAIAKSFLKSNGLW
ncbi:MAG: class D beta-lactamase [Spirochaetes bacterium]|nr:class D beta-lactamase [Spirochaetota bacterium]